MIQKVEETSGSDLYWHTVTKFYWWVFCCQS